MDIEADPPVVGIGASAGGINALQAFFQALPNAPNAAFVVVVYLDPEYRSELANILASRTAMPVTQVEGSVRLQNNHVYVIAPNCSLNISDHMITATPFEEARRQRAPIDQFFRSLAAQRNDGFAIILTGAGADGSVGVKAIKEAGGIVLVQDPTEAEYASMPRSAIATQMADFVLPLTGLAQRLVELLEVRRHGMPEQIRESDEETVRRILAHIRVRLGHDFSQYKRATILRRIARRMQVARKETLVDYYAYLRDNVQEAQALFADFLISVTTFFRDAKAYEVLAREVIPRLFKKGTGGPIRVWVPGCATGEEAYSIAILLLEEAARQDLRPEMQVFGSDLDPAALAMAREGRFPATIGADVSEDRLRRFFQHEGDHYRVRRELRDVVLFASHSLLRDPPFSRLDVISCRNLLIYLDRELQQQVVNTFHYALNPGGFLFLGASETADQPSGLFRPLDRDARIFHSIATAKETRPGLPVLLGPRQVPAQGPVALRAAASAGTAGDAARHRQMLEKIAPPSMLVDESHHVVHLSETAGRFLQPAGGPMTTNAIDMVRPELRFDLRAALHRAFERGETTLSLSILVQFNGAPHRVYLQVRPVREGGDPAHHALILFIEGEAVRPDSAEGLVRKAGADPANEIVRKLQEDLDLAQSKLRGTREEFEGANEELRAANEELQSINEEYRSTSEELETSKEELQSINEELQTVNNELKLKLETVSRAHSDLQNLMAATDFGTLFLDPSLRIKRFTPRLTELFNVTTTDEGRPITDFTHQLDYDLLAEHARTVLNDLTPIEREVQSRNGGWFLVRIRPYRTVDDKIDGVVVTFIDITDRRRIEQALRDSETRLRQETRLVELSRAPIFVWDFDDGIVQWNRGSEELYGFTREEAVGQRKDLMLRTSVPGSSFDAIRQSLQETGAWSGEVLHRTKSGRTLTIESRIELLAMGERRLVLESTRDVTDQNRWEQRRQLLLSELSHRVSNTLTVVQSMARQTLRTAQDNAEFVDLFEGRLAALARSHKLLVEAHWEGAELDALTRSQLEAYVTGDPQRLRIEGPPVMLPSQLATPFGLVLHELATNAAKYGAFSVGSGQVTLAWTLETRDDRPWLRVLWQEAGGPPVTPPTRKGFGGTLIERGLPGARVRRDFAHEGLTCTIELELVRDETDGADDRAEATVSGNANSGG
ncbi:CheR family methyltransferase [Rhodopila globiformis]|uniref:Chemotaxis protein n=1 Tax=Rhodopila globiformis TaxID=1071 RepID=A0A2S6NJ63_RHOGL|nr:CheR family methyltransferase [Rhodopila globiformis]PPQ34737.1 chemotaxis protein [Rhodopila globiformis]